MSIKSIFGIKEKSVIAFNSSERINPEQAEPTAIKQEIRTMKLQIGDPAGVAGGYLKNDIAGNISLSNNISLSDIPDPLTLNDGVFNVSLTATEVILLNTTKDTVSFRNAGTAYCSQPFTGASYKKVIIDIHGAEDVMSWTFPVAFDIIPFIVTEVNPPGLAGWQPMSSFITVLDTTHIEINVPAFTPIPSGIIILEGY